MHSASGRCDDTVTGHRTHQSRSRYISFHLLRMRFGEHAISHVRQRRNKPWTPTSNCHVPDADRVNFRTLWHRLVLVATASAVVILTAAPALAVKRNGFDLSDASIPVAQIRHGGPPRDGIPAIDLPVFGASDAATFLDEDDRVLGFARDGDARAYPIRILDWHEIVNDRIGDRGLLITYCPLCGTGMAFEVDAADQFGVSGLLYNSDVLLYDRRTDSLWSQILGSAVTGLRNRERLRMIPLRHTTWRAWRQSHPTTLVMQPPGGRAVDYTKSAYRGYHDSARLYFPVAATSRLYHPKDTVIGIDLGSGGARAYPLRELDRATTPLEETIGGVRLRIHFDAEARTGWVERLNDDSATEFPSVLSFWFAWYAFHPDTTVFRPDAGE